MVNPAESANKADKAVESNLTNRIREAAKDAGWPDNLVSKLSITVKDDKISVAYPDKFSNQIEDLEYGTGSTPPSPILRTFVQNNRDAIDAAVSTSSLDYLFDVGILP